MNSIGSHSHSKEGWRQQQSSPPHLRCQDHLQEARHEVDQVIQEGVGSFRLNLFPNEIKARLYKSLQVHGNVEA